MFPVTLFIITKIWNNLSSVQSSRSVISDSLQPHGLQHTRLPCPSPSPGVYSDSCPSSQWCHPTISSSVIPFSSRLQSFPASGSFPMSQLFASGGRSIGPSALASVLPMHSQDWFPLGWTGWNSLQSKGLLRVFSSTTVQTVDLNKLFTQRDPIGGKWEPEKMPRIGHRGRTDESHSEASPHTCPWGSNLQTPSMGQRQGGWGHRGQACILGVKWAPSRDQAVPLLPWPRRSEHMHTYDGVFLCWGCRAELPR